MKKLLSLLSILTISGATMPMVVAASHYQQTNNLENNEKTPNINLENNNQISKTSNINLENNNQISKTSNINLEKVNNFPENEAPILRVSGDVNNHFKDLCKIIEYLQRINVIRTIRGQVAGDPGNPISCGIDGHTPRENYFINPNQTYNYFIIPTSIEYQQESRIIKLVFRSSDFYLQGFINNGNYYYFNETDNLNNIPGYSSERLNFNGSYTSLIPSGNPEITWGGIQDAFFQLSNMGNPLHQPQEAILRASLVRVILATSESIRFREVQNLIINSVSTHTFPGVRVYWERNFTPIIKNWLKWTKEAINYIIRTGNLLNFPRIQDILIFTSLINDNFKSCDKQAKDLNSNEYCFNIPEKIAYFRNDHGVSKHYAEYSYSSKEDIFYDYSEVELGDINPLNYNKIEFFGEQLTKVSWGNDAYYGTKINDSDLGKNFKEYIENIDVTYYPKTKWKEVAKTTLNSKCHHDFMAWMCSDQNIGITFYLNDKTKKWHIQIVSYVLINKQDTYSGGSSWVWVGEGIKLS